MAVIVKGANVHSHHDHRIAMACAVAALKADGETMIEEAEAVNKSYPDFYDDLKSLGADVSLPSNKFKFINIEYHLAEYFRFQFLVNRMVNQ